MSTTMGVPLEGVRFDFGGGRVRIIPPLGLRDVKRMRTQLAGWGGEFDDASVDTVVEAAWCALRRNYPEITLDEVFDLIDVGNMQAVFAAVMDAGGLIRKSQEIPPGEAQAPSTGARSTPT